MNEAGLSEHSAIAPSTVAAPVTPPLWLLAELTLSMPAALRVLL
jgi:hypothetical protein